jgi:aldehyde dehydrogenase (NAD+)
VGFAVNAASAVADRWATSSPGERATALRALRDELLARRDFFAALIAIEVGSPVKSGRYLHVGMAAEGLEAYAEAVEAFSFSERIGNSCITRHPVGVVGAITPWNYPLSQIVWKIGAAIAAGCPVVLKPSEVAPLTAMHLARVWEGLDLPPGLLNVVPGYGGEAGQALVEHPLVSAVSFTGSTQVGRQIAQAGGRRLVPVTLELGGKSASLVWADEAFERAVKASTMSSMLNAGQTCSAWTRLIVPANRIEEATQIAVATAAKLRIGDPLDETTTLGPLVSGVQRERVRELVRNGIAEGAVVATPHADPSVNTDGYFFAPVVFTEVASTMDVARREIFGPVMSILPAADEDDAVRQANDSAYGLSGAVWADRPERAVALGRRLRTGQVYINGAKYNPRTPFGGWKDSGLGREWGGYGIEEFLQFQAIQAEIFDAGEPA